MHGKVNAMEFVLLLAIFLTSSGYLFKAAVPQNPPAATAPAAPAANAPAVDPTTDP
ncbi:hypothetical protein BSFA1_62590 (plasmid) [Burkholderia sp. SFA1]|nr:hypothetical protein BSFA1_62590 [Burkholderia sp. SFA1]